MARISFDNNKNNSEILSAEVLLNAVGSMRIYGLPYGCSFHSGRKHSQRKI